MIQNDIKGMYKDDIGRHSKKRLLINWSEVRTLSGLPTKTST